MEIAAVAVQGSPSRSPSGRNLDDSRKTALPVSFAPLPEFEPSETYQIKVVYTQIKPSLIGTITKKTCEISQTAHEPPASDLQQEIATIQHKLFLQGGTLGPNFPALSAQLTALKRQRAALRMTPSSQAAQSASAASSQPAHSPLEDSKQALTSLQIKLCALKFTEQSASTAGMPLDAKTRKKIVEVKGKIQAIKSSLR